jgi:hypothetical protein
MSCAHGSADSRQRIRSTIFVNRCRELERVRILEGEGGVTHLHYRVVT